VGWRVDPSNGLPLGNEAAGISCWMAPRDVPGGALYADAIVRAINEARGGVREVMFRDAVNPSLEASRKTSCFARPVT
jgi:hypothetical protein